MLRFYTVELNYIEYLKRSEIETRGFTRVPNMYYPDRKAKFVCGVVKKINGFKYFAPITSYHTQKSENICIPSPDDAKKYISSIRFNYMFPVPDEYIFPFNFSQIDDLNYKKLVEYEYKFLKSKELQVFAKADDTYRKVISPTGHANLKYNSCDFLLLEQKCLEYISHRG